MSQKNMITDDEKELVEKLEKAEEKFENKFEELFVRLFWTHSTKHLNIQYTVEVGKVKIFVNCNRRNTIEQYLFTVSSPYLEAEENDTLKLSLVTEMITHFADNFDDLQIELVLYKIFNVKNRSMCALLYNKENRGNVKCVFEDHLSAEMLFGYYDRTIMCTVNDLSVGDAADLLRLCARSGYKACKKIDASLLAVSDDDVKNVSSLPGVKKFNENDNALCEKEEKVLEDLQQILSQRNIGSKWDNSMTLFTDDQDTRICNMTRQNKKTLSYDSIEYQFTEYGEVIKDVVLHEYLKDSNDLPVAAAVVYEELTQLYFLRLDFEKDQDIISFVVPIETIDEATIIKIVEKNFRNLKVGKYSGIQNQMKKFIRNFNQGKELFIK